MKPEVLTAIIAGSSVLGGVLISEAISLFRTFLNRRHEKRKLLRQKYEEMMFYFSASLGWIKDLNNSTTRSAVYSLAQSTDARKALTLCLLYFPKLVEPANNYIYAQQGYYALIIASYNEEIQVTAGGQSISQNKASYEAALKTLFEKKDHFENLIK